MSYKYKIDVSTGRLRDPRLYKSSGSSAYYENANTLYGAQADTANFMLGLGKQHLPGAVSKYAQAANAYSDPGYEASLVGSAVGDVQSSLAKNREANTRSLASMGVNPADAAYGTMLTNEGIRGAGLQADAMARARMTAMDKRFGASKDLYSNLVGMPSDAAATAGQAASGFASMGANREAAANQNAAGWGQAVGLGASMYFKNGGAVKMAGGGLLSAGNFAPPPQPVPQQTGTAGSGLAQGVSTGTKLKSAMSGSGADNAMGAMSKGMATAADLTGSSVLGETALNAAGASGTAAEGASQVGMLMAQNEGLAGATAATTEALGAGTAVAGEAAAAASPALSAISTALP